MMRLLVARAATALIAVACTACTSFRPIRPPSHAGVLSNAPHVILRLTTGERMELFDVQITQDSVIGYNAGNRGTQGERRAVATSNVGVIKAAQFSTGKTVFVTILATLSLLVIAGVVAYWHTGA